MNILYLHGLDSKLSPEKREILEKFGKVFAPDLDYYEDPNAIERILNKYKDMRIDCDRQQYGRFCGLSRSNVLSRPALLFNPALKARSVPQNIPAENNFNDFKRIVIGQKDDVVSPGDTLGFISKNFNPVTDLHLRLVPGLGHRIPLELFEEEVEGFLGKIRIE